MAHDPIQRTYDKRTSDRYVARGVITHKDVEKHIKALPDLADKAVKVETELALTGRTPSR